MTFEYTDADGDRLTVHGMSDDDGRAVVHFGTSSQDGVYVDVDRVEEVVAGIRDAARQATGQPGLAALQDLIRPLDARRAAGQPTLRDRLRRAVCEASGIAWDSDMLEPDEYGDHADAVLAVLAEHEAVMRRSELLPEGKDFTPAVGQQDAPQPTTDEAQARAAVYGEIRWPEWNPACEAHGVTADDADRLLDAYRAAILNHAADALDADMERFFAEWPDEPRNSSYANARKDATALLRRLAAGTSS